MPARLMTSGASARGVSTTLCAPLSNVPISNAVCMTSLTPSLLPRSAATAAAHTRRTAEAGGRRLAAVLRPRRGGGRDVLAGDDHVALMQLALDHLGRGAVAQTHLDAPRLELAVHAQDPHAPRLAGQHGLRRASELGACALLRLRVRAVALRRGRGVVAAV